MSLQIETIIIGSGQAGLSTAYHLTRLGRECVVFEQASQTAHAWRTDRWDSFTLVTPNWGFRLPGAEYDGPDPDGFMPRDDIIARFEAYIEAYHLPVQFQTHVIAVERRRSGTGYRVITADDIWECANVVVTTGLFQQPRIPGPGADLSPAITQIASGQYRNPESLLPGGVLVVGSAQSGCQIAEELYLSGRRVFLCVGSTGRAPRRYRGKDIFEWLRRMGFFDRTVDKLESPKEKFQPNPHVSGAGGGHTLNLHQFARDGVVLLGRLQSANGGTIRLAPDLHESLTRVDEFEKELVKLIDSFIERTGTAAPAEELPAWRDGYNVELLTKLNLPAAGISTIIWATGYRFDFSLVQLPVTDSDGYPIQKQGVTNFPGLYFVGLPWLNSQGSGLLIGVGRDAEHVASAIAGRIALP